MAYGLMDKRLSVVTSAYKSERFLEAYFHSMVELVNFSEVVLIVVLNQPTSTELSIARRYHERYPTSIRLIEVERESIGASLNRGFHLADTDFVAYADVDDWRVPDCYARQLETFLKHPEVDFTYGDFVIVPRQGATDGQLVTTREYNCIEFTRGSYVGPNHFFRRHLLEKCGFWDEQLRSGGDFDFQVRAALHGTMMKTPGVLLYYTSAPNSGSASSSSLQPIERTVIELRYGIYDKIDYDYLPEALRYSITKLQWAGEKHPVNQFVPDYDDFMRQRYQRLYLAGILKYLRRVFLRSPRLIVERLLQRT